MTASNDERWAVRWSDGMDEYTEDYARALYLEDPDFYTLMTLIDGEWVEAEDEEYYYDWEYDRVCSWPCHICGEEYPDDYDEEEGDDDDELLY